MHRYEYAGAIVEGGGGYYATPPVTIYDTNDFGFTLDSGVRPVAIYHTHPIEGYKLPALASIFSPDDVNQAEALGVKSYIGSFADHSIRYYDPRSMKPRTIRDFRGSGVTLKKVSDGELLCAGCF